MVGTGGLERWRLSTGGRVAAWAAASSGVREEAEAAEAKAEATVEAKAQAELTLRRGQAYADRAAALREHLVALHEEHHLYMYMKGEGQKADPSVAGPGGPVWLQGLEARWRPPCSR